MYIKVLWTKYNQGTFLKRTEGKDLPYQKSRHIINSYYKIVVIKIVDAGAGKNKLSNGKE